MVASGTWTDPKTGASYAFGDKLPSSDFNSWIGGIRTIDQNVVVGAVSTFPHRLQPGFGGYRDAVIEQYGTLVLVGDDGSGNASGEFSEDMHSVSVGVVSGATGYQARTVDSDGSGNLVMGLSAVGTSTDRIRTSTNAGNTWSAQNLPTAAIEVTATVWAGTVFVAAYDPGAATNRIATSPTGVTWTDRANPLSNSVWTGTSQGGALTDGSGNVVLIPGDVGAAAFAYSADGGLTWSSAATTAATWAGGAYSPGFGYIAYSRDGLTIWSSSGGSAWSAASGKTLPAGMASIWSLAAVGNVLVMLYYDGTSSRCVVSPDWGATWGYPVLTVGGLITTMRSTRGRLVVLDDQGTEYAFVSSRVIV